MTRSRRRLVQPSPRPPQWLAVAAACFLLYFAVLLTAESLRAVPSGIHITFERDGADVEDVLPGSAPAQAGLLPGDRILTAAGRPVRTPQDWYSVSANMLAGEPVPLVVERAGAARRVVYTPPRQPLGLTRVRPDTLALLSARIVQLSSLVLALVIIVRRAEDRLARLTAWLLASFGVFTVLLPYGFARIWRLVPLPLQPLLWGPYLSGSVAPAIFFAFAAEFPRPFFRDRRLLLAWCAPALLPAAWHAWLAYVTVYRQAWVATGTDWSRPAGMVSMGYLLAGLVMLAVQYRRLDQAPDRRRLRVLLAGTSTGLVAGGFIAAVVLIGRDPRFTSSLLASPATIVAVPLLAALPASMAYTILRHRWLGLGVIVRQGVRYALARRLLISLVPVLLGALALDLVLHRDHPLDEMLRDHWWRYGLAFVALMTLLANRRRWLLALDRRFFHEHYRAEQIFASVAVQLRQAVDPSEAVAAVVRQIDKALQPTFAGALARRNPASRYDVLAATATFPDGLLLDGSGRLVALAAALDGPLDLSPDRDAWLARNVPPPEAAMVAATQLELLVPVSIGRGFDAVLALGPRRSEEPYSTQDTELLRAIASSLALVLERTGPIEAEQPMLAECPECARCFDTSRARCPEDGALLLVNGIPRVLGGRYTLLARLQEGGMGVVYRARDESLGRDVAIKVVGEHLVGSPDAAHRFEEEARTSASFTHPHVVTIHDFGIAAGNRAFLVMEQLVGRTLREEISRTGPVPAARALSIVTEICEVLSAAHGRGLVHRDLKPDNVFLTGEATPGTKVIDFGIAKALTGSAGGPATGTRSGVLIGSVPYMSPEQLRGEAVDPSWDLWALGVMCQEMLTGERPLPLLNTPATERPLDDAAAGQGQAAALTPALRAFFARALALDRSRRPGSAAAFREEFAAALGGAHKGPALLKDPGIWTPFP
jgi:hypothetical protein